MQNQPDKQKDTCQNCGAEMEEHTPGIGWSCKCINCGFKDPCCD